MGGLLALLVSILLLVSCAKESVEPDIMVIDNPVEIDGISSRRDKGYIAYKYADESVASYFQCDEANELIDAGRLYKDPKGKVYYNDKGENFVEIIISVNTCETVKEIPVRGRDFINIRDEVFRIYGGPYIPEDWRDIQFDREGFDTDPIYSQMDFYDTSTWIDVFVADAARHGLDLSEFLSERDISITSTQAGVWTGAFGSDVQVTVGLQLFGELVDRIEMYGIEQAGGWFWAETMITIYHELGHAILKYRHTCERTDIMGGCYEIPFPDSSPRAGELIPLEDGVNKINGELLTPENAATLTANYDHFVRGVARLFSGEGQLSNYAIYHPPLYTTEVPSPVARTNDVSNRE